MISLQFFNCRLIVQGGENSPACCKLRGGRGCVGNVQDCSVVVYLSNDVKVILCIFVSEDLLLQTRLFKSCFCKVNKFIVITLAALQLNRSIQCIHRHTSCHTGQHNEYQHAGQV